MTAKLHTCSHLVLKYFIAVSRKAHSESLHILGKPGAKLDFFARYGMDKADLTAVKGLSADYFVLTAVHSVAVKGSAEICEMYPYLMRSARFKVNFKK